jgi:transposase InsO family protein
VRDLVSIDFFVVPTIQFKVLFVLVVLAHRRRRIVHFNVTDHPSATWTAQQIVDAFPWDEAPRYLLRDRDRVYGAEFKTRIKNMGMQEVLIAPRSPWQNPFAERLIGSIRRECLDHVIVLNEAHMPATGTPASRRSPLVMTCPPERFRRILGRPCRLDPVVQLEMLFREGQLGASQKAEKVAAPTGFEPIEHPESTMATNGREPANYGHGNAISGQ